MEVEVCQQETQLAGWIGAQPWDSKDVNSPWQQKGREKMRGVPKEEPQVSVLASSAWAQFYKSAKS